MLFCLEVEDEIYFEWEFMFALIVSNFLLFMSIEELSPKVLIDFYVLIKF